LQSDNNCRNNFIIDTCQSQSDGGCSNANQLGECGTSRKITHGIIKYYNGEYFYSASDKTGYPLFKTDLVLLGSISDCDYDNIPIICVTQ